MSKLVKYPYRDLGHLLNRRGMKRRVRKPLGHMPFVAQCAAKFAAHSGQLRVQRGDQSPASGLALVKHLFEACRAAEIRIGHFPFARPAAVG
jgi:hypothetical protein